MSLVTSYAVRDIAMSADAVVQADVGTTRRWVSRGAHGVIVVYALVKWRFT